MEKYTKKDIAITFENFIQYQSLKHGIDYLIEKKISVDIYVPINNMGSGFGDMYTYSATNVRLAELSLGYDIPINKYVDWIKGLNVSFIGKNLFFLFPKRNIFTFSRQGLVGRY